jgi:hypothetical protein
VLCTAWLRTESLDIDQTAHVRGLALCRAVVQQLVFERLATATAMHEQVFQFGKARQVDLQLRIAPARVLAHPPAAKAVLRTADLLIVTGALDHLAQEAQEPARLRRQLIERAA